MASQILIIFLLITYHANAPATGNSRIITIHKNLFSLLVSRFNISSMERTTIMIKSAAYILTIILTYFLPTTKYIIVPTTGNNRQITVHRIFVAWSFLPVQIS